VTDATAPRLFLGHGASGSIASMRPWIEALAPRGFVVEAVAVRPSSAAISMAAFDAVLDASPTAVIGGHSFGGRMASMVAANRTVSGLVLLSYPLHAPGKTELRDQHFPQIKCPVLVLSGERDQFARIDSLRHAVQAVPIHSLVTYPHVGHGLLSVIEDAADQICNFLRHVVPATR
jgi:predicted alpha/beta-hydrolase family hydrolase